MFVSLHNNGTNTKGFSLIPKKHPRVACHQFPSPTSSLKQYLYHLPVFRSCAYGPGAVA